MADQPKAVPRRRRHSPRVWSGLALGLADERAALIGPEAARFLLRLFDASLKHDRHIGLPDHLAQIRDVLAYTAGEHARSGPADVRHGLTVATSPPTDWIGTPEVARMLGCTREHANRLARQEAFGHSRLRRNKRTVERVQVEAYIANRRDK